MIIVAADNHEVAAPEFDCNHVCLCFRLPAFDVGSRRHLSCDLPVCVAACVRAHPACVVITLPGCTCTLHHGSASQQRWTESHATLCQSESFTPYHISSKPKYQYHIEMLKTLYNIFIKLITPVDVLSFKFNSI